MIELNNYAIITCYTLFKEEIMQNQVKIINLVHVLAPIIASRDSVRRLKVSINQSKVETIEIDFSNVEFISRSATHELLKLRTEYSQNSLHKRVLVYKNMSDNITKMINIVAKNKKVIPTDSNIEQVDIHFLSKSLV